MQPLKRNMGILFSMILAGLMALPFPTRAGTPEDEILHLLQYVRESQVTFIRNGQEYPPAKAADHLLKKRRHFNQQISSAEDFIRLTGTQSLFTGQPYQIKMEDGTLQESSRWLGDELARYRALKK